ncbi:MAG: polyprenyl synthetase family protein [Verrucomicrobia bacterium]|nr:polyprenyl synthetase family protein [Verrucomicrobiota bacterium]
MLDLDTYLRKQRDQIDRELDRRLPAASTRPAVLHTAMRYSLFPGGKRLRPILCLAAAETVSAALSPAARESAMRAALALEILHTYTLVHDDLPCMDDDALRRGRPTVHVAYGEANAVLVGDALQALAFAWLAGAPEDGAQLVAELAIAAGSQGVVGGQVEDIAAAGKTPTAETVAFIHQHKTGDLFRAATRMGAIAAGASPTQLDALTRYGDALGAAFQITDDLLDAGDPVSAGSAPARPPPLSCLSVMTVDEAQDQVRKLLQAADQALAELDAIRRAPLAGIARGIKDRKT